MKYIRHILIILAAVLVMLLVVLFVQYQSLEHQQGMDLWRLRTAGALERHAPLPVSDAGIIRTWMTFDYVNKLFALPATYLQEHLQIQDPRYPRLTISNFAKTRGLTAATFLDGVSSAVRSYASSSAK